MTESAASHDILATLSRLLKCGALPSVNLDSDDSLVLWSIDTNEALDALEKAGAPAKPPKRAGAKPASPTTEVTSVDADALDADDAASAVVDDGAGAAGANAQPSSRRYPNPDELICQFANCLSGYLRIRGYDDVVSLEDVSGGGSAGVERGALPKGAAQLVRHGHDVARISMLAQRLADEVSELHAAKLRMQQQHAAALEQQAAAYRDIVSGLLEQQARLERALLEEREARSRATAALNKSANGNNTRKNTTTNKHLHALAFEEMSIDLLPDAINFGKNSRALLSASVMPLVNKALQKVMLQLPSNPAHHVAEYLRENNPNRGSRIVEISVPALFMSQADAQLLQSGAVRMDAFDTAMRATASRQQRERKQTLQRQRRKNGHDDDGDLECDQDRSTGAAVGTRRNSAPVPKAALRRPSLPSGLAQSGDAEPGADLDGTLRSGGSAAKTTSPVKKSVGFALEAGGNPVDGDDDGGDDGRQRTASLLDDDDDDDDAASADGAQDGAPGSSAREFAVHFSGREIDGASAKLRQCGGLPVWTAEPPLLEELPRLWTRLKESVWHFEHEQRDQQQHDMNGIARALQDESLAAVKHQQERNKKNRARLDDSKKSQRKPSDSILDEDENDSAAASVVNRKKKIARPTKLPLKVHWVVAGVADVHAYVGGIPMRASLSQEVCAAANSFKQELAFASLRNKNNANITVSDDGKKGATATDDAAANSFFASSQRLHSGVFAGGDDERPTSASVRSVAASVTSNTAAADAPAVAVDTGVVTAADDLLLLEATVLRALQAGGRLRASVQQRFRTVTSYETAIADAALELPPDTFPPGVNVPATATTSSSSAAAPAASSSSSSSSSAATALFAVHRINEYQDVMVSEQTIERLHHICELVAAERATGTMLSVVVFVSSHKASFVRTMVEFATAYFLQRQRALHSDRVGFAISNELAIREMMTVLPINEHAAALQRRRARDERRAFLAFEQQRYLRTNELTEAPEIVALVAQRNAERQRRRERADAVAHRNTNSYVARAATRIQMAYKGHAAWKSLLQGRGHAVERFSADIPDPALLRAVTDHLRDALGGDIVADPAAPRPKAPMLQTRQLRLVRYKRVPPHETLRERRLDVSSEDEEWYEVEQVRSSESNIAAAMQAVQAPCRPWDDVATICRWAGEDSVLEQCCALSDAFTGQCSLETRVLRDLERLAHLTIYDVYCYALWRDRTAENRSIAKLSPVTTAAAVGLRSASASASASFTSMLSQTQAPLSPTLSATSATDSKTAVAGRQQRHALPHLCFSQFLETCCSTVCVLLSSPQFAVAAALGTHRPWTPGALAMSSTDTVATSSNANRERKRTGTVLAAESTLFTGGSSGQQQQQNALKNRGTQHQQRQTALLKRRSLTPAASRGGAATPSSESRPPQPSPARGQPQHPNESPFARRTVADSCLSPSRSNTIPQVPLMLTIDGDNDKGKRGDRDKEGTFQNRAAASEGERSSEFGLHNADGGGGGGGDMAGGDGGGGAPAAEQREQRAIRLDPRLTQVEQPLPDMPFFFVSEAMPMKAVFDTSRSLFANGESIGGSIKGVVWVSTIAEPLLYVEEDEVITLAARPAHATFELHDLFPKGMFRGYSEAPPIDMKVTHTTNRSGKTDAASSSKHRKTTPQSRGDGGGGDKSSSVSGSTMTGSRAGKSSTAVPTPSNITNSTAQPKKSAAGASAIAPAAAGGGGGGSTVIGGKQDQLGSTSNFEQVHSFAQSQRSGSFVAASARPPPPDPSSAAFWQEQERAFQERVKLQLTRWRGALFLFGTKHYSECSDLNGVLGASKPSRTRSTFWYGPQAGGVVDLFGSGSITALNGGSGGSGASAAARQHPALWPVIRAMRKKIRVAPENLQYELTRDPTAVAASAASAAAAAASAQRRKSGDGGGDDDDGESESGSGGGGALAALQNVTSTTQLAVGDLDADVESRPMSATHSSIGSWSDVVGVRDHAREGAATAAVAANALTNGEGDDDLDEEEDDDDEDGTQMLDDDDDGERRTSRLAGKKKQQPSPGRSIRSKDGGGSSANGGGAERQLMLPQVRASAGLEHLVRNKLIAYKCGHHNDRSKGDPSPFVHLRFPIHDSCGRAFFDRVEELSRRAELQIRAPAAFVFGMSSLTSVFSALVMMLVRIKCTKTATSTAPAPAASPAEFYFTESFPATSAASSSAIVASSAIDSAVTLATIEAECDFLSTQHVLFHTLYASPATRPHFVEIVALLRRCGLLVMFVGALDVHRRFAEKTTLAESLLPEGSPLQRLRAATAAAAAGFQPSSRGATEDGGALSSSPNSSVNGGDLAGVQKMKLVHWFAAQSAQRIERFAMLVLFHHFLHHAKQSGSPKTKSRESFFHFCSRAHPDVMSQLLGRIDPWELPMHSAATTGANDDVAFMRPAPAPHQQLSHAMRRAQTLPAESPLHPFSNATHKSKRWSQELWTERAA